MNAPKFPACRERYHKAKLKVSLWEKAHEGKIIDVAELIKAPYSELEKATARCIWHNPKNRTITLYFRYPYEIDLDRIPTPLALINWLMHMLTKSWFGKDLVRPFLLAVCAAKHWDIYKNDP